MEHARSHRWSNDKMASMLRREPDGRLTIKAALLLGFGLTLGIWLVAGYSYSKRISETETRANAINARYMQAQELLSTVRAQVLLGSLYVRDALLDPNPVAADYRRQLEDTYDEVTRALQQYVPVLDSRTERQRVGRLQQEIGDFRRTLLEVLATDTTRWPVEAQLMLQSQVVPKRTVVIRVSEEVQALNRTAFVQQQREVAEIYADSQRRLWENLGLALAASLGVALLATVYAGRLENHLHRQRLQDAENAKQLQHLSAKLITAQEEERRTVARELHDEVGQVLMAIKVELSVAQRAIEAAGGSARVLEDARSITEGALSTVRDLSHFLHPALLDDLGLPAAIEWYLRGFSRRHDVRAEVLHDNLGDRLAPEIEASAYRIVQEALTNVAKHARATACRVCLQRFTKTVLITVEDNGVGFDAAEVDRAGAKAGLGLISIRERATQLHGTARFESAPGKGTRLIVELPIRRSAVGSGEQTAGRLPGVVTPAALNG